MISSIIQITMIVLGLMASFYLFYKKPFMTNQQAKKTDKKLSVIIPCRNEEQNLPLLLTDLLNQTTKPYEIIVVDDGSTDNTQKIAKTFPVKVVAVKNKNPEYIGKSWAVETGSKEASGELLLFLDADVRLGKNAIKNLLQQNSKNGKTVITVQPYHKTEKFYEQFSLPFNIIQLAANEVTTFKGKPFGLYGPVILIDSEIYKKIGRHYTVRQSIIEDVSLGMELTKQGYDFKAYLGNPEISFRMYSGGFKSLVQGWTKNIAFGASKTSFFVLLLTILFIGSILGTFIGAITYLAKAEYFWFLGYVVLYAVWALRLKSISKPVGKFSIWSFVLYPVIFTLFVYIFFVSMFKKIFHLPVKWKGRLIK